MLQSTLDIATTLFPEHSPILDAVQTLSESAPEERGAIYTRREVVEFILDLTGYVTSAPLYNRTILEPSFGGGDFLGAMVERLVESWKDAGRPVPATNLAGCITAIELHRQTFEETKSALAAQLREMGFSDGESSHLLEAWLAHSDYLLHALDHSYDHVVGNPPYVRQEVIPDILVAEYRARFKTIYDRADLYVPFIEKSLNALKDDGSCGFICSDRWMKNRYGGPLREMVSKGYRLRAYIDMVDTPAFHSDVVAYPAITLLTKEKAGPTKISAKPEITNAFLTALAKQIAGPSSIGTGDVIEALVVGKGREPWIMEKFSELALVRRLEKTFPTLEQAGCKVGIGVATGADAAFIGRFEDLDVEDDRKLPLAKTRDIKTGTVEWLGLGVINPFGEDGHLVDLTEYPRLSRYLEERRERISNRHVAKKNPKRWFRTIDRIYPEIAQLPKLLIPDIKGDAQIVFEDQGLYPHHNLYFVTSETWDMQALQAVLSAGIAHLFVALYSTKMRGGFLRFQAQYLRRICVPAWQDVSVELQKRLHAAGCEQNGDAARAGVIDLYGLTPVEQTMLWKKSAK
jgi:hypothetical protein